MQTPPVVLITGCSSGIGRAVARAFHARGCQVYATARQRSAMVDLEAEGLHIAALDVTDEAAIATLIPDILQRAGRIDILVNNAGYAAIAPLLDLPIDAFTEQMSTNVSAPLRLIQAVAPAMVERRRGLIVNIGSVSGILVTPFAGAYCASKAALHALSDALRMELAPFHVQVVTVKPGAIQSGFGAAARQRLARLLPERSLYQPIRSFIEARALASQMNATPTADFAHRLVARLLRPHPPPELYLGYQSRRLPWVRKWLPLGLCDRILRAKFGLNRLSGSGQ